MNSRVLFLALFSFSAAAFGAEPENTLEVWTKDFQYAKASEPVLIALHATLSTHDGKHCLAFRLTNISKHSLHVDPWNLPWGNLNAVRLAAFTTDGKRLQNEYPIDDPPYQKLLTIASGQTLRGEQPIAAKVIGIDAPRNQDTVVLWSYRLIDSKRPQTAAICTGAIVIPKSK